MPPDYTPEEVTVFIATTQRDIEHICTDIREMNRALHKLLDDHEQRIRDLEKSQRVWGWGNGIFAAVAAAIAGILGSSK